MLARLSEPRLIQPVLLVGMALVLQGCGLLYKSTGDVLINYGKDEMLPYVMTYRDTEMGCAMGESLTPLLMSFEAVGSDPDKLAVLVYLSAASCAQDAALTAELRYLRNINQGDVAAAQDARIVQKRKAALAARRQYEAYQRMISEYGDIKENHQCPDLDKDYDQIVWMAGLIAGAQALMNDSTSGGQVGVPRNIPAKISRGANCLDNAKWWGVPKGIQGAIWNLLPPLAPENAQPWKQLERAQEMGFEQGVRLGSALYAMAAYSQGDTQRLREAIRRFAEYDKSKINQQYRLFDAMAHTLIQGISDRMWTEATGKRTPVGALGTFWDEDSSSKSNNSDIQDLL